MWPAVPAVAADRPVPSRGPRGPPTEPRQAAVLSSGPARRPRRDVPSSGLVAATMVRPGRQRGERLGPGMSTCELALPGDVRRRFSSLAVDDRWAEGPRRRLRRWTPPGIMPTPPWTRWLNSSQAMWRDCRARAPAPIGGGGSTACTITVASVLGFGGGAAPEIIDHSCTGYLCQNEEEMITTVADMDRVDRRQCRAAAERRFSRTPVAASYPRPCHAVLERPGRLRPTCGTR
jgi:hypothetical protein